MTKRSRSAAAVAAVLCATAMLRGAPPPPGAPPPVVPTMPGFGNEKIAVRSGEPTNAGSFDGTWMYVNRDVHFALWIRTRDGKPEMRLQYQSLASPEAFETDWSGKASYYMAGNPVEFEIRVGQADANAIDGHWSWDLTIGDSARRESADLHVFRTGYGRALVMRFDNYVRTIRRNGQDSTVKPLMSWSWTKVSKREVLWDELPW